MDKAQFQYRTGIQCRYNDTGIISVVVRAFIILSSGEMVEQKAPTENE
jgi:hypothetical protein